MAITKAIKEKLQQSSNNVPERVTSRGSNAMRLKLVDGKSVMLLNNKGEVTEYGKYWYNEVKQEALPREGFDPETPIIRRFNTDYIKLRNGNEAKVRAWDVGKGTYKYTKMGRQYFAEKPRRYIVSIPIRVHKNDDVEDGRGYKGWYDAKDFGPRVRAILDSGVAGGDVERLKVIILRELVRNEPNPEEFLRKVEEKEEIIVIYEQSDVIAIYDPEGGMAIFDGDRVRDRSA